MDGDALGDVVSGTRAEGEVEGGADQRGAAEFDVPVGFNQLVQGRYRVGCGVLEARRGLSEGLLAEPAESVQIGEPQQSNLLLRRTDCTLLAARQKD